MPTADMQRDKTFLFGASYLDVAAELEELFELDRDNAKIRQMKKDVEEYERTIQRKVQMEEQAGLKEREAEKLDNKAAKLREEY